MRAPSDSAATDTASAINGLLAAGFTLDSATRNPATGQATARVTGPGGTVFYLQTE